MPLFSVHCVVAGKRIDDGLREQRWLMMPVHAVDLAAAVKHEDTEEFVLRLTEGLQPPIVVSRQAYYTYGGRL